MLSQEQNLFDAHKLTQKFVKAARSLQIDKIKKYIALGVDVNATDLDGNLALTEAVPNINRKNERLILRIVKLLLKSGVDVNKIEDSSNDSALISAVIYGRSLDLCKLLLKYGANVNSLGDMKRSALMWATCFCKKDIIKLLLEHGADIYSKDVLNMDVFSAVAQASNYYYNQEKPVVLKLLETEKNKIKCIGEIRKNARVLEQGYRQNTLLSKLPPEILTDIAAKTGSDIFPTNKNDRLACRFFARPPKGKQFKVEQKHILEWKNSF